MMSVGWGWGQVGQADRVERDLRELGALIVDESASQARRDEAARRLVARKAEAASAWAGAVVVELARELLLTALVDVSSRGGQLAVARALAQQWDPDPVYIAPLNALLGGDRQLTEAAATALATYTTSPQVPGLLLGYAGQPQRPEALRVAVIRSLGAMPERSVAAGLLELATAPASSPAVRAACLASLADLTGMPQLGESVERWAAWWEDVQRLSDVEFRGYVARTRASHQLRLRQRLEQLNDEVALLLPEGYRQLPEAERSERLLRLLRSGQPSVRAAGVRMVLSDVLEARGVAVPVREALRQMVGDSSRSVRLEVATALRSINDASALDALLTQLPQESSAEVRSAIAAALGPMRDVRATDALLALLGDADVRVAESAAEAMASLAPEIRRNPGMSDAVAIALRSHLLGRGQESANLRAALLEALVPLRRRELLPLLPELLAPEQPPRVRRAAVRLLGELSDPSTGGLLTAVLASSPADATLRLEAITALGSLPTFEHADTLDRYSRDETEPDAAVRARAWSLLAEQFQRANRQQLRAWVDRLVGQPARQLEALTALADQLRNPEDEEALSLVLADRGRRLLELERAAEAVVPLRESLAYWLRRGANAPYVAELAKLTMDALLRSRQYAEVVGLLMMMAGGGTSDANAGVDLAGRVVEHAGRLSDDGERAELALLVEELSRVAFALNPRVRERLGGLLPPEGGSTRPGAGEGANPSEGRGGGQGDAGVGGGTRPTTAPATGSTSPR